MFGYSYISGLVSRASSAALGLAKSQKDLFIAALGLAKSKHDLLNAISAGNNDEVRSLLKMQSILDDVAGQDNIALKVAVAYNNIDAINMLLQLDSIKSEANLRVILSNYIKQKQTVNIEKLIYNDIVLNSIANKDLAYGLVKLAVEKKNYNLLQRLLSRDEIKAHVAINNNSILKLALRTADSRIITAIHSIPEVSGSCDFFELASRALIGRDIDRDVNRDDRDRDKDRERERKRQSDIEFIRTLIGIPEIQEDFLKERSEILVHLARSKKHNLLSEISGMEQGREAVKRFIELSIKKGKSDALKLSKRANFPYNPGDLFEKVLQFHSTIEELNPNSPEDLKEIKKIEKYTARAIAKLDMFFFNDAIRIIKMAYIYKNDKVLASLSYSSYFKSELKKFAIKEVLDCVLKLPEKEAQDNIALLAKSGAFTLYEFIEDLPPKCLDKILNIPEVVETEDKTRLNALTLAVAYNSLEQVKSLLSCKAIKDSFLQFGMQICIKATSEGKEDIFKFLVNTLNPELKVFEMDKTELYELAKSVKFEEDEVVRMKAAAHRIGASDKESFDNSTNSNSNDVDDKDKQNSVYRYNSPSLRHEFKIPEEGTMSNLAARWLSKDLEPIIRYNLCEDLASRTLADLDISIHKNKIISEEEKYHTLGLYQEGKPVAIRTGCQGHGTSVIAWGNYLSITNRGFGAISDKGTTIIKLKRPLTAADLDRFTRAKAHNNMSETYKIIAELGGKDIDKKKRYNNRECSSIIENIPNTVCVIEHKNQKYGSCAFVNLKSSIEPTLAMAEVLNNLHPDDLNGDKAFDTRSIEDIRESFKTQKRKAHDNYKIITATIRDNEVKSLLSSLKELESIKEPSAAIEAKKEIYISKLLKYIEAHHGKKKDKIIENSAVERAQSIYIELDKMGVDLEHKAPMTFGLMNTDPMWCKVKEATSHKKEKPTVPSKSKM